MFTNPARAGVLGAHVLGSFHPVYAENKISLDNACFPKGSHCCYVKLGQINPLVIEEMIKGERAMQKFAGLMKGLASKGAKTASSVLFAKEPWTRRSFVKQGVHGHAYAARNGEQANATWRSHFQ